MNSLHYSDFTKEGLISISYLPIHSGHKCQYRRSVLSADVSVLLEQESWVQLSTPTAAAQGDMNAGLICAGSQLTSPHQKNRWTDAAKKACTPHRAESLISPGQ